MLKSVHEFITDDTKFKIKIKSEKRKEEEWPCQGNRQSF